MPYRTVSQRGAHPYYTFADPGTPDIDISLWPLLLSLIESASDNQQQQIRNAQDPKSKNPTVCKVIRTPIDPVYTILEVKDGLFTISIPLGQEFKPENVDVKVRDRQVVVEIKSEQSSEDGTSQLTQVFTKKVPIPEEVKAEDIKSRLTHDGVLKIEAPLPVPEEPPKPQAVDIPVTVTMETTNKDN